MLYLFALVFASLVQEMSTCNPNDSCGCSQRSSIRGRIIGGESALQNSWSWMVSLRDKKNQHFCGGSILNERYVITAAHCFADTMNILSSITVCAGTKKLSGTCSQSRQIQIIIKHPSHDEMTSENDIALIQVKTPFNFTDTSVGRICLPNITHADEYPKPGTSVTTIGWGGDGRGQVQDALKEATLQVVDRFVDDCDAILYNGSLQLCARASGKDTSAGDAGGPLMVFTDSKRWELVGITSYGSDHVGKYPGVYTRVTAFLTWVQHNMNNTSSESPNPNFRIFTWSNGDRYEGEFKRDKMHGKGTLYFANGEKYTGNWINGKRTGGGVFTWPDGSRYVGAFRNNVRTGYGGYTWPNGNKYEGQFNDSKFHGRGKLIYANGTVVYGKWLNNRFVN